MFKLVLLRHGQSQWNLENRFTGWTDVPLTERGLSEARRSGQRLKENGFTFDCVYTNYLKRAIKTSWLVLEEMDLMYIPVYPAWQLNERHYGALQGLNKTEMAAKYGEEQVHIWRRSFDTLPPFVEETSKYYPGNDPRYQDLLPEQLPKGESLKVTIERVLPYWQNEIVPSIKAGKKVLVSASGNSLRALVKIMDASITEEVITDFTIPTGFPLVYELDDEIKAISSHFLGSDEELKAAIDEVKNQGKSK